MATLTFSFDTGTVPISTILDAFGTQYGYRATVPDPANPLLTVTNPETQAQFARRMVKQYIVDVVKGAQTNAAINTARAGITEISLT
jgi:hypothetical protein